MTTETTPTQSKPPCNTCDAEAAWVVWLHVDNSDLSRVCSSCLAHECRILESRRQSGTTIRIQGL